MLVGHFHDERHNLLCEAETADLLSKHEAIEDVIPAPNLRGQLDSLAVDEFCEAIPSARVNFSGSEDDVLTWRFLELTLKAYGMFAETVDVNSVSMTSYDHGDCRTEDIARVC